MRIEVDERVFLVEGEVLGQPIKRTGVVVLYINRKRDWRTRFAADRGCEQKQNRQTRFHRAPWIFGFWESFARNSTCETQVSWLSVPGCTFLMTSFTAFTGLV